MPMNSISRRPGRDSAPHLRRAEGGQPVYWAGHDISFLRMPTSDLADWKNFVEGIHDDGGNTLDKDVVPALVGHQP